MHIIFRRLRCYLFNDLTSLKCEVANRPLSNWYKARSLNPTNFVTYEGLCLKFIGFTLAYRKMSKHIYVGNYICLKLATRPTEVRKLDNQ